MTQSKKYDYRVVQDNTCWSVEIIRRVTAKKTVVSKSQGGFASEAEAQEWGKTEKEAFLQRLNLNEQNKRRSKKREQAQ